MKKNIDAVSSPFKAEVFRFKPNGFASAVEVAACYVQTGDQYLFLHRAEGTLQAHTWGIPAGKLEGDETPRAAAFREVREEVGLHLDDDRLHDVGAIFIRYPHLDFTFHMFQYEYADHPNISLSDEHHEYRWVTVEEAMALRLIAGGRETLEQFLALR